MRIIPFQSTTEQYIALIALHKLLQPENELTVDILREEDQAFAREHEVVRVLGEFDNRVVTSGIYWHTSLSPNEPYHFAFSVHPDYQESDVPGHMQRYLLDEIEKKRPIAIASQMKEDEHYRVRLLETADFKLKMRFPRSQVDVTGFDAAAAYDAWRENLKRQGIEFVTLTDVMEQDANWQQHVWQMFTVIERDIPTPDPEPPTPFEEYADYYEGELFRPDSWVIAVDTTQTGASRYVGMCVVNIMPARPDTLFAGITGVIPGYRRRKIATVLKVCSIHYAQRQGYRYIYTNNEENNPMYDLNLQLGFKPLPAWVFYKKEIK